jgi:broad specificity phosphatase PhoE
VERTADAVTAAVRRRRLGTRRRALTGRACGRTCSGESYLDVLQRLDTIVHELERQRDPILIISHQVDPILINSHQAPPPTPPPLPGVD